MIEDDLFDFSVGYGKPKFPVDGISHPSEDCPPWSESLKDMASEEEGFKHALGTLQTLWAGDLRFKGVAFPEVIYAGITDSNHWGSIRRRQACHSRVGSLPSNTKYILTAFNSFIVSAKFEEELNDYYTWLVNESYWCDAFVVKDISFLKEYGSVIRVDLPKNIVSGALIAFRRPFDNVAFLINWRTISRLNDTGEKLFTLLWCDTLPQVDSINNIPFVNLMYGHSLFDARYFTENCSSILDKSKRFTSQASFRGGCLRIGGVYLTWRPEGSPPCLESKSIQLELYRHQNTLKGKDFYIEYLNFIKKFFEERRYA